MIYIKKNIQLLYYLFISIAGIGGLIYYIFVPNLFLLTGSIIFVIIGLYFTRSTILEKEFKFGMIGHISFIIYLLFLASVYFIEFETVNDYNPFPYGILFALGAIIGIFMAFGQIQRLKRKKKREKLNRNTENHPNHISKFINFFQI